MAKDPLLASATDLDSTSRDCTRVRPDTRLAAPPTSAPTKLLGHFGGVCRSKNLRYDTVSLSANSLSRDHQVKCNITYPFFRQRSRTVKMADVKTIKKMENPFGIHVAYLRVSNTNALKDFIPCTIEHS